MSKRFVFIVLVLVMLLTPAMPNGVAAAVPPTGIFATPVAVMSGGTVTFSGYGYIPDDIVPLYLLEGDGIFLGEFTADSAGNFSGSVSMPPVAPGSYVVETLMGDASTSVTILPPLVIDIDPASGFSGTMVHFWVYNLAAGQLRLDYNGAPVYGPVDVPTGTFEGDFLVPITPVIAPPADIEIDAVNLVGGTPIGTAATFFVYEGSAPASYAISDILLPPDGVDPGYTFPISGQISPPPIGPLSNYQIKILWKAASGKVVPITVGTPSLLANGSFSAQASVPSLLAGDPLVPEQGGQVGVAFFDLGNGKNSNVQLVPWINPADPVFKVKVVDSNGDPIQNAIVDVRAFYSDFGVVSGQTNSGEILQNDLNYLSMHPNQVNDYLGSLVTGESDPFTCKSTNVYGRTDENGIFEVKFDPASFAMLGKKIFLGNLPEPTYMDVPWDIEFPLYVNGLYQGYGTVVNNQPQPFKQDLRYSGYTHFFYDVKTNTKLASTDPYVVTLPALPGGTQVTLPIVPKSGYAGQTMPGMVLGGFDNYLGTGIPMTAFGNFYSFPTSQFPADWFTGTVPNVFVEFQHDPSLFGALDETKLTLTLNGQVIPFVNVGSKFEGNSECLAVVYRAIIPNLYRWVPGNYSGMIELHDIGDNITKHYVQFNIKPAPTWLTQPQYKVRKISFIYTGFSMRGYQFPSGDPNSTSNLDTNINKIGQLNNRASFSDEVSQYLYADKTSAIKYSGQPNTTVMNENAGAQDYSGTMAGGTEIAIPTQTITVLDTGKIPLYRHVIGIPPIAGATLGADMWFDATLSTGGSIKFTSSGSTTTTLLVYPDATVGVDAFLDGEVLFGLASASAHAKPDIGLGMPAYFTNGSLDDTEKCFHYKLVLTWSAKAGICPFCVKGSGEDTIFNDRNPSSCAPPPAPSTASLAASTGSYLTAETPQPPTASPSLAVDGFGNILMVWSDQSNNIQSKTLSGGLVVGEFPVTGNNRGIDPQVAFFAPNNAVAVWTESSLSSSDASGAATIEQIFQAQYLKYAVWNGINWGAAQNLTLPADSNGEGKVVLAGCPSAKPGCPTGGQVTAVWVRDMGTAYSQRNFRLYYAAFNGTSWSTAAAVDPSSTGTDAEATLAYTPTGVAQVVWVRDLDRDLSTAIDRWLYHRQLSGGSPVTALTTLPNTAVEPSLAVNSAGEMVLAFTVATDPTAFMGNQRQLYAAEQSCGEGGCTWSYNPLVDINGRPVHAETPSLTLNSSDQALITYRALGFGAAYAGGPTVLSGDPLGTVIGTGEMAQAFVTLSGAPLAVVSPSYLTTDGNTIWQTTSAFDPVLNLTYSVASQGSGPALPQLALNSLSAQGYPVDSLTAVPEPLALSISSAVRDLSLSDVSLSTLFPQVSGDPLTVIVSMVNNGPAFASTRESGYIDVVLSWDGPDGVGTPAGAFTIQTPIEAGGIAVLEFSTADETLTLPAFPYLPHTLYVQVNPSQAIAESDYENNTYTINLGGLPAPQGLRGAAQPGDSSVFLEWEPVEHESLAGYRIYRSSDGRIFKPVGSSFSPAFVDLSGVAGRTYLYTVVSYAADGFESDFADPIQAQIDTLHPVFLPLVMR